MPKNAPLELRVGVDVGCLPLAYPLARYLTNSKFHTIRKVFTFSSLGLKNDK